MGAGWRDQAHARALGPDLPDRGRRSGGSATQLQGTRSTPVGGLASWSTGKKRRRRVELPSRGVESPGSIRSDTTVARLILRDPAPGPPAETAAGADQSNNPCSVEPRDRNVPKIHLRTARPEPALIIGSFTAPFCPVPWVLDQRNSRRPDSEAPAARTAGFRPDPRSGQAPGRSQRTRRRVGVARGPGRGFRQAGGLAGWLSALPPAGFRPQRSSTARRASIASNGSPWWVKPAART